MKLKKVYLLSGPSGSGKSTWARSNLTVGSEWISRDNVRFSIIKDGEDYFSHEIEVFDTFIDYINQALKDPNIHTIFIDATHLNKRSREKTLRKIHKNNIEELNCVYFITSKEVCQVRNQMREGLARVPATVINNMFNTYVLPDIGENFTHIYEVNEQGIVKEVYLEE